MQFTLPPGIKAAFGKSEATLQHIDVIVGNVRRYVAIAILLSSRSPEVDG